MLRTEVCLMVAWLLGSALTACVSPPVFNGIEEVIVHKQTAAGTHKEKLEGEKFQKASNCLYSTTEVTAADSKQELLQEILILQVKDRLGDRMFELYTDENLKGNKGQYFRNSCVYKIIRGA
jgi:hypothetical protein